MAIEIGEFDSGPSLINFLVECGVEREKIVYPNTKWRMINDVFLMLTFSDNPDDKKTLFKIIADSIHPLMHNGDRDITKELFKKFNNLLNYDNLHLYYNKHRGEFSVDSINLTEEEMEEISELQYLEEQKELAFLNKPENTEKISLLHKTFLLLMNVVEIYCGNPSQPTSKLNKDYLFLDDLVRTLIRDLNLGDSIICNLHDYNRPFTNLFAAEQEYKQLLQTLSWESIRPQMNARYGDIEQLYQIVNGSNILADQDTQKQLNDIQFSLSVLKKKREMAQKMHTRSKVQASTATTRIEIVKMPPFKLEDPIKRRSLKKNSLRAASIELDDNNSSIKIDRKAIPLPPYKNEHFFCRAIFQHPVNEFVDWSIIFESMDKALNSVTKNDSEKDKRMIQDTMYAVNKRIREVFNTDDDLFTWKEKAIKRNF